MVPTAEAVNVTEAPPHNNAEAGLTSGISDATLIFATFDVTVPHDPVTFTVYEPESVIEILDIEYVDAVAPEIATPSLFHW